MSSYDVVFVGAGISSTFTFIEFLALLELQASRGMRVLMIDRDPDFFKGIPYGARSGDLGLIISRSSEFLPAAHLAEFGEWLAANRNVVFDRFFALGGVQVEAWREKYWQDVQGGSVAELHLPRYVFGLYFEHLARQAIDRAEDHAVATCDTVVGEVVDVTGVDGAFTVVTRDSDGRAAEYTATRVVLGIGSSPTRSVLASWPESMPIPVGCAVVDDPFDPGIDHMLRRVREATQLAAGQSARVLIVGSNASALDIVYNLMNDRAIAEGIDRIDVISTSGRLPELFVPPLPGTPSPYVPRALEALATRDSVSADEVLDAVRSDLEQADAAGAGVSETLSPVTLGFISLLDRLSPEEKQRFATETGPRIGELQRRAGLDYRGLVDALVGDGKVVVRQGRVPADLDPDELGGLVAIINCTGSDRLGNPGLRSPLLRALLVRGDVRATGSGLGIRVTDDLECDTPGLYVIGPLLTGNVVRGDPAWNLEHCGRIAMYARRLAAHLVDRTVAERAA